MPSSPRQIEALLTTLKHRFGQHMQRHAGLDWAAVQQRLQAQAKKWPVLEAMEATGGEPDVIGQDTQTGEFLFCDCSAESPAGRRSLCYDQAALDARKENRPEAGAIERAVAMGIELLNETQYRHLQTLGRFDTKTSSWIDTPAPIRRLGGALFCDRRYDTVFVYHNGAQSYYAARGFRGILRV